MSGATGTSDYRDWATLRSLDAALGLSKGSAFRAFKRLAPQLTEDVDYHVLQAGRDRARIDAMRSAGDIYAASIQVVLLSPALAERLRQQLAAPR